MAGKRDFWLLLPRPVRRYPADLAAVVALVILTGVAVFAPGIKETPLRIVVGLPFALFLPGYAFIAALFPEAGTSPAADSGEASDRETTLPRPGDGIDGLERVALSFGLSIAITPLIGLVLNFTPWGVRLAPVMLAIGGFTVAAAVVAAVRRWELPEDERFAVPYRAWYAAGRDELFHPETRTDLVLNVLLVVSLLIAAGSVAYAVGVPKQGEAFTEFYLLTEGEDGELVADDYPENFTRGERQSLVVGVGNHEHERTSYVVVVLLQRVEFVDNSTRVLKERELQRFQTTLGTNETWHHEHAISPPMTGQRLRLQYLLYKDSAPSEPTTESAYREVHLWVNVSAPDSAQSLRVSARDAPPARR